jgi:hypothetical protein
MYSNPLSTKSTEICEPCSPGGCERGERADDSQSDQLTAADVKCAGGEATLSRGPDGQLTTGLVVQNLTPPLVTYRYKLQKNASAVSTGS